MQCVAPLASVPPLNLTLMAIFLFTRHGERAPVDRWARKGEEGVWICEGADALVPKTTTINVDGTYRRFAWNLNPEHAPFKPSCDHSGLTLEGMRQHAELGQFYRKLLVTERKFLPDLFDPELVTLRASQSDRTIKSLIAFVNGMYPPAFVDEVLHVQTGVPGHERLNPDPYGCTDLQRDYREFVASEEFVARANVSLEMQKALYEYLGLKPDAENWQWLGDWMYSYKCSGKEIPKVVTDQMFERAMNDTVYYAAGFYRKYLADSVGPIWRLLLREVEDRLSGIKRAKFTLFSAHDATLMAIRAGLGYVDETEIAPYRSHLMVEMYEENGYPKLRFVYNGEVLPVTYKGKKLELITLSQFKNLVAPTLSGCAEMY